MTGSDEIALRRPGFRPDVAVKLADGQTWYLQKPTVKTRRKTSPDRPRSLGRVSGLGDDYDRRLDDFYAAEGAEFILAQFDLAAMLLQRNYDLTDEQADSLLVIDFRDEASPEDLEARTIIQGAIQGLSPKPSDSGDDPP